METLTVEIDKKSLHEHGYVHVDDFSHELISFRQCGRMISQSSIPVSEHTVADYARLGYIKMVDGKIPMNEAMKLRYSFPKVQEQYRREKPPRCNNRR